MHKNYSLAAGLCRDSLGKLTALLRPIPEFKDLRKGHMIRRMGRTGEGERQRETGRGGRENAITITPRLNC